MTRHDPEIEELRDKVHCAVVLERTPAVLEGRPEGKHKAQPKVPTGQGRDPHRQPCWARLWDPTSDAKGDAFRVRPTDRRPPLPHPGHRGRLHPRVPGAGGGQLVIRPARGAGAGRHYLPARAAGDDRQRQRHGVHLQCHPRVGGSDGIAWHYIALGKPQQNGFIERIPAPSAGGFVEIGC
jgi:hypothetical protein